MQTITAKELRAKLDDGDHNEILIDVREPHEYRSVRIAEAKNIPLNSVRDAALKLKGIGTVYVHCGTGMRSSQACNLLAEEGVHVVNVEGGISAWEQGGFGVVKTGKQVIPIVRQMMIVAGIFILTGMSLGTILHAWWYMLVWFVGFGLLFGGITGICGMTSFLKYMPWNR